MFQNLIRAIAQNADGMARATLKGTLAVKLKLEDVTALGPDILAEAKVRCLADTMVGNEIRMGGFKALTKVQFKEGIEADIALAKTQGGHGSRPIPCSVVVSRLSVRPSPRFRCRPKSGPNLRARISNPNK